MVRKISKLAGFTTALMLFGFSSAFSQIAVVVNNNNPVSDLSLAEIKRIYMGKKTSFDDGRAIYIAVDLIISDEFYKRALEMPAYKMRRHWVKMIFSGALQVPPESFKYAEDIKAYVSRHPGAIAFLDAADADSTIKIISIDGKKPGDEEYPLR